MISLFFSNILEVNDLNSYSCPRCNILTNTGTKPKLVWIELSITWYQYLSLFKSPQTWAQQKEPKDSLLFIHILFWNMEIFFINNFYDVQTQFIHQNEGLFDHVECKQTFCSMMPSSPFLVVRNDAAFCDKILLHIASLCFFSFVCCKMSDCPQCAIQNNDQHILQNTLHHSLLWKTGNASVHLPTFTLWHCVIY